MDENTEHSCENCTHCDVIDYYCYKKYKPIEFDDGTDCEEWELYEE